MSKLDFDHIVIYVPDLKRAVSQFVELGFNVHYGGEHVHSHNALIYFDDKTYLELLAIKPGWKKYILRLLAVIKFFSILSFFINDVRRRIFPWIENSYGLVDWVLRVDKDCNDLLDFSKKNNNLLKPKDFSRHCEDGKLIEWSLGGFNKKHSPLLIKDKTDIDQRILSGNYSKHVNKVTGIKQIDLISNNPVRVFQTLVGLFEGYSNYKKISINSFSLSGKTISLINLYKKNKVPCIELSYDGSEVIDLSSKISYKVRLKLIPNV